MIKKDKTYRLRKKESGICQYGGCWTTSPNKTYCKSHAAFKMARRSKKYNAAMMRRHVRSKRSQGYCGQGGCWVKSLEKCLCPKHMKEATYRKAIRRMKSKETKSYMAIY